MAEVVLAVQSLGIEYGSAARRKDVLIAVENVSFSVSRGQVIGLIGPSGCGKTSIVLAAAGLLKPIRGRILVNDAVVDGPYGAGCVFQAPALLPWRNVVRNAVLGVELRAGRVTSNDLARCVETLEQLGLRGFENYRPAMLSGGMQQRVAVARALMSERPLLLLDEPFSSLDAVTRRAVAADVVRLVRARGHSVLLVTHSVEEAARLCDAVVVLTGRPARVAGILSNPASVSSDRGEWDEFDPRGRGFAQVLLETLTAGVMG